MTETTDKLTDEQTKDPEPQTAEPKVSEETQPKKDETNGSAIAAETVKEKENVVEEKPPTKPLSATPNSEDEERKLPTAVAVKEVNKKKREPSENSDLMDEMLKLKRRKINVAGAPKLPQTGYVRFMNDRREVLRREMPTKTAIEISRMIGEEWQQLPEERKTPYLQAAAQEKQRYLDELNNFLKAHPDILASELAKAKGRKNNSNAVKSTSKDKAQGNESNKKANEQHAKEKPAKQAALNTVIPEKGADEVAAATVAVTEKPKVKRTPTPTPTPTLTAAISTGANHSNSNSTNNSACSAIGVTAGSTVNGGIQYQVPSSGEIPIFTNDFLEHNKILDMELRMLRKSKADLEQKNAVLEKHVENMKAGQEKVKAETDQLDEKNQLLETYLRKMKQKLTTAFSGLAIPTQPNGSSAENVENFMQDLFEMTTSNTHGPASLNKAKDIIRKLDLQISI